MNSIHNHVDMADDAVLQKLNVRCRSNSTYKQDSDVRRAVIAPTEPHVTREKIYKRHS